MQTKNSSIIISPNNISCYHYDPDHSIDATRYCVNDMINSNYCLKNSTIIKKVIFNNPRTIVIWGDNTKTIVKKEKDDIWDPEKGLAMAIVKKYFGKTSIIKKWTEKLSEEKGE